ncbi:MAG: ATP-dependent Clp protease proteolytic subunit [Candidatus Eremiobacteraeota bacterium]|nr:ATP-dependent Clp protease proteolytic subunit [Candidatus Eremiobacteraeota bacterium]
MQFDQLLSRDVADTAARDALSTDLLDIVPRRAFDPIEPSDEGMLFFHSEIEEKHVVPLQQQLIRTHLNLPDQTPITLFLSSVGGNVFAGLALVSTITSLRRSGRTVNVHIEGVAMSMASVIAQVANYRTMEASSFFLLHEVWYRTSGRVSDHGEERAFQERLQDRLYEIYANRTGKSVEYYRKKLYKTDWYLDADEALREGLVDAVLTAPGMAKPAPVISIRR